MPRELPGDQTKRGMFTQRSQYGDWRQEKIDKMIRKGHVCPTHHMVLNAHGKCPMCGTEYKTKG